MTIFQKNKFSSFSREISDRSVGENEATENYLSHPTLGLLYSVCKLEDNQELFTTIYANRLFFLVTTSTTSLKFEPISRTNARLLVENYLLQLRRLEQPQEYDRLYATYQQTF